MRNKCNDCAYYHKKNNTCQSKKCATAHEGYVTFIDRLFCKPYKKITDEIALSKGEK